MPKPGIERDTSGEGVSGKYVSNMLIMKIVFLGEGGRK